MFLMLARVETSQCTYCDVMSRALCHACTYPADTQKVWLIYVAITMHVHTILGFSLYVCSYV